MTIEARCTTCDKLIGIPVPEEGDNGYFNRDGFYSRLKDLDRLVTSHLVNVLVDVKTEKPIGFEVPQCEIKWTATRGTFFRSLTETDRLPGYFPPSATSIQFS